LLFAQVAELWLRPMSAFAPQMMRHCLLPPQAQRVGGRTMKKPRGLPHGRMQNRYHYLCDS
jgi:hypothetical protein